jgi:hypothetical protein
MRIIFVRDHIVSDEYGLKVGAGRTGVLLDDSTGLIELDEPDVALLGKKEIVWGTIDGVQPANYIPRRDDIH